MSNTFTANGKSVSSLTYILKSCTWNSSEENTLIKVLVHLHRGDLMEKVLDDYEKLDKGGKHYMSKFYDAICDLNKLLPFSGNEGLYIQEIERKMFPTTHVRLDNIAGYIHQTNYDMLKKHNLIEKCLLAFGGCFRGIISDIHAIPNNDFLIIETSKGILSLESEKPFVQREEVRKFYSSSDFSLGWRSFNGCLIYSMFPNHYKTVHSLHQLENNEFLKK